jgi:hypothetical protein
MLILSKSSASRMLILFSYVANVEDAHGSDDANNERAEAATRISFDKGGSWRPLKAPQFDHKGNRYTV